MASEQFDETLRTFRRLLETTTWTGVSPEGKAVAFDILKRILVEAPDMKELYNELGTSFDLPADEVSHLATLSQEEIVASFNKPIHYEQDWITTYLSYTANHEAPTAFHFWTACSVISAATKRGVYFDQSYYKIFPNLFIVLVAPAGRCRRSVATSIGMRILREANVTLVLSEKITPEGLAVALHNVGEGGKVPCAIHIHASELSVFLGRQQYNEGLIALLTTLYDSPETWEYVTRTKSEVRLARVFLTMLGATAPDWLADSIPPVAFGGGFLSRTLVVAAPATDRIFPFPVPQDPSLQSQLVARLRSIAQRSGAFRFTPAAKKWYEEWYDKSRLRQLDGSFISGYYERKQDHIIRVATIIALSQEADLEYTPEILERALKALEDTEPNLPMAFRHIGTTREGKNHELVLWYFRRNGGARTQEQLLRSFVGRLSKQEVDRVMDDLRAANLMERDNDTGEWKLTPRGWEPDSSILA
jgi:hypothetical protein